jgi:hypothetical protein
MLGHGLLMLLLAFLHDPFVGILNRLTKNEPSKMEFEGELELALRNHG